MYGHRYAVKRIQMSLFRWFSSHWLLVGIILVGVGLTTNYVIKNTYLQSRQQKVEQLVREIDSECKKISDMWLYNENHVVDLSQLTDITRRYRDVFVLFYHNDTCKYWSKSPSLPDTVIQKLPQGQNVISITDRLVYTNISEHNGRRMVLCFPITHIKENPNLYSKLNSSLDLIDRQVFAVNIRTDIGIPIVGSDAKPLFFIGFKPNAIDSYTGVVIMWLGIFVLMYGGTLTIAQRRKVHKKVWIRLFLCFCFLFAARVLTSLVPPLDAVGSVFNSESPTNQRLSIFLGFDTTIADLFINIVTLAFFIGTVISLQKSFFLQVTNFLKRGRGKVMIVGWSLVSSAILIWLLYILIALLSSVLITNNIVDYISNFNAFILIAFLIVVVLFSALYSFSCFERRVLLDRSIVVIVIIRFVVISAIVLILNEKFLYNAAIIISGLFVAGGIQILSIRFEKEYNNLIYLITVSLFVAAVVFFDCSRLNDKTMVKVAENLLLEESNGNDYYSFVSKKDDYKLPQSYFLSYIKVINGKIKGSGGNYVYDRILETKLSTGFVNKNGFRHYVLNNRLGGQTVIVSRMMGRTTDYITLTFYFLLIFGIGGFVLFEVFGVAVDLVLWRNNLYFMAKMAMVVIFIISIIFVLVTITSYFQNSRNKKETSDLVVKSQNIIAEVKELFSEDNYDYQKCKEAITKMENIYTININIFDSTGKFIMSSSLVAEQMLFVPRYVDPDIMAVLNKEGTSFSLVNRTMDDVDYRSYLAKLNNNSSCYIQIIDYSCFVKSGIDLLLLNVSNIFIVVMLVLFFVLVFFYRQGMKPIMLLRDSLSNMKYQKKIDTDMYRRGSDIDTLVDMYNSAIEELDDTLVKLAESGRNEALKVMSQQVAHEIKNPLTPIKLKAQMILYRKRNGDPNWDKNIEESLSSIVLQIDILNEIITEFSSMATMGYSVKENCDLDKTLKTIVDFYSGYPNIEIAFQNKAELPVVVWMSKDNLWSILTNIMVNAIHAIGTKRDGKIIIALSVGTDDNALIAITDNGTGIEDSQKPNIFRPNFTTKKSGSGIGLTITMGFVKDVGGRVWFDSEYGKGTTFYVELPRGKIE